MLKVEFDYGECIGNGSCVKVCPVNVLEMSEDGRWCKPKDGEVRNKETVELYYDKVEGREEVDTSVGFIVPECTECYSCENVCPNEAVEIGPKIGFEDLEVEEDEKVDKYSAQLKGK